MIKKAVNTWLMKQNGSKAVSLFLKVHPYARVLYAPAKKAVSFARGIAGIVKSNISKEGMTSFPSRLSTDEETEWNSSFRILFAGDLLLLEDQVKRGSLDGSTEDDYNFDDIFSYAKPFVESADLAIGVFEGPMAGQEAGYSNSNYGDGKSVCVNFPDAFGKAVKDAGFNLVTLANNHLMDKGERGVIRTLDVLDRIGIDHVGAYRNEDEKRNDQVKIIEANGLRFAVLSYTFDCSNNEEHRLMEGDLSHITSYLPLPSSKYFRKALKRIKEDFEKARGHNPDLIIVLPHIGMQFLKEPDYNEQTWSDIFFNLGADIVLCDHAHAVMPVKMREHDGRNIFVAYCPGNFTNIYRKYDGDVGMLVEVNIDREKKKIIGGGVIPMWINSQINGNYRPIPLEYYLTDKDVRNHATTYDMERVYQANDIVTQVVFGRNIPLDQLRGRYLFDSSGRRRLQSSPIDKRHIVESGYGLDLYERLKSSKVCFIGDSITEGTMNGGYPWYEPIESRMGTQFENHSWGGGTVDTILENFTDISAYRKTSVSKEAAKSAFSTVLTATVPLEHLDDIHVDSNMEMEKELFVIAIGTNDVRYCDSKKCAMDEKEFVYRIDRLVRKIREISLSAEFVFIAPWIAQENDPFCPLNYKEKLRKNKRYSAALSAYCQKNGMDYIDPNDYIQDRIDREIAKYYLVDHIHPNSRHGIYLYSEAVLKSYKTNHDACGK